MNRPVANDGAPFGNATCARGAGADVLELPTESQHGLATADVDTSRGTRGGHAANEIAGDVEIAVTPGQRRRGCAATGDLARNVQRASLAEGGAPDPAVSVPARKAETRAQQRL